MLIDSSIQSRVLVQVASANLMKFDFIVCHTFAKMTVISFPQHAHAKGIMFIIGFNTVHHGV